MNFTVYTSKDTGGLVVEAALAKAGAPYACIEIDTKNDEHMTPKFTALNPMRQVPTLVLPDGSIMTESAAIVIYLADLFPGKGLAPAPGTPARAKFLRWMLSMATNIYEADLRHFYAERYTADPAGAPGVKAAARERMARCFAVIEPALDPWLCGADLSIADVYLAMLITWSPDSLPGAKFAALRTAVAADKDYGPVWRKHGKVS